MTETRQTEQVRGALGGVVIALAVVIAIFAFYTLARAQTVGPTPSANILGAGPVNNGANNVIGTSTNTSHTDGPGTANTGTTTDTNTTNEATSTTSGSVSGTANTMVSTSTNATGSIPKPNNGATSGSVLGVTVTTAPLITAEPASAPAPMVVAIDREGGALVRGVVTAVGAETLTLATWGGTWTVKVANDTTLNPATGIHSINVGDFVGAAGVVSPTSMMTVNASVVRNWSAE